MHLRKKKISSPTLKAKEDIDFVIIGFPILDNCNITTHW